MFERLSVKLLIPMIIVDVFMILLAAIFFDVLSKGLFLLGLSSLVLLQLVLAYLFYQRQLTSRLIKLNAYLDLVISVEHAPSEPLVDELDDDLAKVTNVLSAFITNLADVITVVRTESETLKQGSNQLASQMTDTVSFVEDSSQQISQMAHLMEQVTCTSSELSESASQVSQTTTEVLTILSQGTESSNTSQQTIEQFLHEITEMANDLTLLQEESSRIGSVLDVIRGIADQTNLLALNAAIEAARAGEQGRGFAVVADEVRALAHRTQESTVEIQSMVEGLQSKSTNAVNAITRGKKLTEDSLSHSVEVVSALEKIGQAFTEVDMLTSQIASGTEAQQQSTASINDNMTSVVTLSQDITLGLTSVSQHAEQQQISANDVDSTLNRVCA